MIIVLLASTLLLAALCCFLTLAVLVLARQIGVLHERIAPIGQQPVLSGLQAGQALPRLTAKRLDDSLLIMGGQHDAGRSSLILFVSPDCPVCKRVLPIVQAQASIHDLDLVLAGEGDVAALRVMASGIRLGATPFVTSQELLLLLQIGRLPTLVTLDPRGVITARDVANTRQQVEALIATLPASSSPSLDTKEFLHDAV
ncbi:alkyl hydroperoxide reductase [Asaia sp. BMEF1]|uniref:alkyl hydroperoxide reductase n=1 Tax=Asaia sp. BMEF1 TaxID=3155932 RepID=UPI003F67DD73